MKLRYKIFLSILVVSITALLTSTIYLINKYHNSNIIREQQRSLNEYDFMEDSLINSMDLVGSSEETLMLLLERFGEYYKSRDIHISLYLGEEVIYSGLDNLSNLDIQDMLQVDPNTKKVYIDGDGNQKHILVSGRPDNAKGFTLLYSRDISGIYQDRAHNITLSLIFSAVITLILGLLSYLFSKWITKPIDNLQQTALSIADGDYDIKLKETNDEFNDLRNAFHTMALAIESRTNELEEKADELQKFIDDLSHEMNTPLTSIQGYAEFLYNANATEEQKIMAADNIRIQSARMNDIYTKLMAIRFSKTHKLKPVDVKTSELFDDIYQTFFPQLQDEDITLTTKSYISSISMDRTLMHILISNLIKNSIQALKPGGEIFLSAYTADDKPVIEVRDTGSGIPDDKIKEITKPFFRIDKSRSRKTGGVGLGLSIVNNIAILHNAKLNITSTLNEGTSIKVVFN